MQHQLNGDADSDIEEVDFKMPIAKIEKSKKPKKIKRSNPHSNLDEDYINRKEKLLHPQWDTLDPTPDITALFRHFDSAFFQGRLKSVTLEWGKRMFSCAGISYSLRSRFDTDVTICLSQPILMVRPRKDLVDTMLHQMIHAYLFLLKVRESNGGHGIYFKKILMAINQVSGTNISTYHALRNDLKYQKLYWWRCNGICQDRGPFFGYVQTQRSCAPDSEDQWYAKHQELCGGTFMRIKGPEILGNTRPANDIRKKNNVVSCDAKRRRISDQDNSTHQSNNKWVSVDEEVMLKDYQVPVITLSSDDEDEASDTSNNCNGTDNELMTTEEKIALTKREIIAESIDLCDSDFDIIGDLNINMTATTQPANTGTIDINFGDTLFSEFKRDNDCKPTSSRYQNNPDDDIIKCYICEAKLPRRDYAWHLNGCAGISKKILPHRKALKKLSTISKEARPKRQTRPSAHASRDILRNAGYTEAEFARIASAAEVEEDEFAENSEVEREATLRNTIATNGSPEILNISSEDESTIRYRQRNLYKTTRECPICNDDVEEMNINDHLDICMLTSRSTRRSR